MSKSVTRSASFFLDDRVTLHRFHVFDFNEERLTRDRQHDIRRTGHVLKDIGWSFVRELRTDWAQRPVSPYLMPPPQNASRSSSLISNTVGHLSLTLVATYTLRG